MKIKSYICMYRCRRRMPTRPCCARQFRQIYYWQMDCKTGDSTLSLPSSLSFAQSFSLAKSLSLSTYVYMYMCICVYTCICVHVYISVYK